jgi:hypothetical protein
MTVASSNLVRIAAIAETVYGETPVAGNFSAPRMVSESYSATPETTESKQIRTDRQSSGQVVTGLTVEATHNIELAKETILESFMESAMFSTWNVLALFNADLSYNAATRELTRAAGSWISAGIAKGDYATLSGMANSANNTQIIVTEVVSATVLKIVGKGLVNEPVAAVGAGFKRADKLQIGTTKKSFSMEKSFLDLTNKAINYKGMIARGMNLNVNYGEIITGDFMFSGNFSEAVDQAADFLTFGRTINPQATSQSMNGSIDMPFVVNSLSGTFEEAAICVKTLGLKLDNNFTPVTCIGKAAPEDYTPGTAKVDVELSAYLEDDSWSLMPYKLTQDPFALGFMVKNSDGWYGFYLPAVQATFDDPAAGGQNQDVMLNMRAMAKVGDNGESTLYIYRS